MTTPHHETTPPADPIADAIAALTAAARHRQTIGAGTAHEHTVPADFAEIACRVLTSVAANLGGVETLLSGRPGSWEADYVRQIIHSTVGDDDIQLMRYRTEPVRINVDVESIFLDFGIAALYDQATEELNARDLAATDALVAAMATPHERARMEEIHSTVAAWLEGTNEDAHPDNLSDEQKVALLNESKTIFDAITHRATEAGSPLVAAMDSATAAVFAVDELWAQDHNDYRQAYIASIHQALTARGLTLDVEVIDPTDGEPDWDQLTDLLHNHASAQTPLPMTGQAPDWTHGTPADALRRAGLTYQARIADTQKP